MGRWVKDKEGGFTYNPYELKFYEKEIDTFHESYHKELKGDRVDLVFRKLKRHYKLGNLVIQHNKRKNGVFRGWCIDVPVDTCFGLLCHEISHAIDRKKRKSKHDKRLMRIVARVNHYCKKKNWFESKKEENNINL